MDISIHAEVTCSDGGCGHVICVLINPVSKKVTHLIVKGRGLLGVQRMVPVEYVTESSPEEIHLGCDQAEFSSMEDFIDIKYVRGEEPFGEYLAEHYYMHPFVVPDTDSDYDEGTYYIEKENIPPGELAIYPGTEVYTVDEDLAGTVDEFLVSPEDEKITHLILREGHLWGRKHVTIPVSAIDHISIDGVHLKLTKEAISQLPAIPVRRTWATDKTNNLFTE